MGLKIECCFVLHGQGQGYSCECQLAVRLDEEAADAECKKKDMQPKTAEACAYSGFSETVSSIRGAQDENEGMLRGRERLVYAWERGDLYMHAQAGGDARFDKTRGAAAREDANKVDGHGRAWKSKLWQRAKRCICSRRGFQWLIVRLMVLLVVFSKTRVDMQDELYKMQSMMSSTQGRLRDWWELEQAALSLRKARDGKDDSLFRAVHAKSITLDKAQAGWVDKERIIHELSRQLSSLHGAQQQYVLMRQESSSKTKDLQVEALNSEVHGLQFAVRKVRTMAELESFELGKDLGTAREILHTWKKAVEEVAA